MTFIIESNTENDIGGQNTQIKPPKRGMLCELLNNAEKQSKTQCACVRVRRSANQKPSSSGGVGLRGLNRGVTLATDNNKTFFTSTNLP